MFSRVYKERKCFFAVQQQAKQCTDFIYKSIDIFFCYIILTPKFYDPHKYNCLFFFFVFNQNTDKTSYESICHAMNSIGKGKNPF